MDVLMIDEPRVRELLDLNALLDALADGFKAISSGATFVPPRVAANVPGKGLLAAMPGWGDGIGLGAKLVSVFPVNEGGTIPSHQAIVCLFDPDNGSPVAVMDGTYITAIRTAAGAALSTRLLAREDARTLAILGASVQGASHLTMFPLVRDFTEIRIASRTFGHAEELARSDPRAHAVSSFEEAVRGADVVALCTSAGEPVARFEWLSPGAHVTSVGYAPPHGELDRAMAERASLFVEARVAFEPPPAGCAELAGIDPKHGAELGEVLLGVRPGRRSEEEITVYKSMGHAIEDIAAAQLVYERARQAGGTPSA